MRNWLRELDQHSAGLENALAAGVRLMRETADDPAKVEGELRENLRQAASLVEQLGQGQQSLIEFNRRSQIRFAFLSLLFLGLFAVTVGSLFFR